MQKIQLKVGDIIVTNGSHRFVIQLASTIKKLLPGSVAGEEAEFPICGVMEFDRGWQSWTSAGKSGTHSYHIAQIWRDEVKLWDTDDSAEWVSLVQPEDVKPQEKQKHAELIKLWADGAIIQYKLASNWFDCDDNKPMWSDDTEYRVKPDETNVYLVCRNNKVIKVQEDESVDSNLKLTFNADGTLKSAEISEE